MTLDINEDKHTFNIRLHVSGQFFFFLEVNMIVKIDQMSLILGFIPSIQCSLNCVLSPISIVE